MSAASHEFLEHVGELELRIEAPSREELFAEAARALGSEILRGAPGSPDEAAMLVTLQAADPAALLVEFLNEIVYRADAEGRVLTRFEFDRLTATEVRARGRGVRLRAASPVKAATYHGAMVAPAAGGGFVARVILDI
ncbi:MAG TPA: archease [Polyangia bacterium]|jgi:SHS2 domain-containing protein